MRENVRKLRLNYEDLIIALVMLLLIVFFAVLPMRNSSIRHAVVFSGSVLFYGLATVRILRQNLPIGFFFRLVGLFVLILLGILLTVKEYDYEVFYAALNFLALFVLMTTKSNLSFSKESLKIVFFGAIVLTALVTLLSFSSVAYWFEDGRSNGALALGMTNSNVTGVMLSGIISILLFF